MKFISFWYDKPGNNYYKNACERLSAQMKIYNYDFLFEELSFDNSSYEHITLHKPTFILDKLEQLNTPVCWIDIDCQIIRRINLDIFDSDICLGRRDPEKKAPHASVIFINNNDQNKQFLLEWKKRCDQQKNDPNYEGGDHCQLILTYQNYDLNTINIKQIDNLCSTQLNSYIHIGISNGGREAENIKFRKFGSC